MAILLQCGLLLQRGEQAPAGCGVAGWWGCGRAGGGRLWDRGCLLEGSQQGPPGRERQRCRLTLRRRESISCRRPWTGFACAIICAIIHKTLHRNRLRLQSSLEDVPPLSEQTLHGSDCIKRLGQSTQERNDFLRQLKTCIANSTIDTRGGAAPGALGLVGGSPRPRPMVNPLAEALGGQMGWAALGLCFTGVASFERGRPCIASQTGRVRHHMGCTAACGVGHVPWMAKAQQGIWGMRSRMKGRETHQNEHAGAATYSC
jgi:hypothetical protein